MLLLLQAELDHLHILKAAEEGDVSTLQYFIQERKCDVDTCGQVYPYVSKS